MPQFDRVKSLLLPLLLALVAGLAQALSLAAWDGQPQWWLQILALGCLCWQLTTQVQTPRQAFTLGWVFATAWLSGTFWWLFISMYTYGGLAAPLTVLAVVGLAGVLALYYAFACAAFKALAPSAFTSSDKAWGAVVFAALWLLAELARAVWFTGFPWGAVAYAHVDGPLAAYAPWVGAWGMNALVAGLAMLGAQAVARVVKPSVFVVSALLCVIALPWGLNAANRYTNLTPDHSAGRFSLTLLQGNIPQDEKFEQGSGVPLALQWYAEQLKAATTSLVVAPETAVPMLPSDLPAGYLAALQQRFAKGDQAALVGIPLGSMADGYTNSVIALAPEGAGSDSGSGSREVYRYDKHHLVPFGEFIPPAFRWFTQMMHIPLGDFNRGAVGQPSFAWQGQRLAPNICYEDLFGEELGARFADPATAPTVFVNISNIGWFGDGAAMSQHLQISRLRALEFARPMVRATNTGATVVIDHLGRVTAALPRSTRAALRTEVEGRNGVTFYAQWVSRFGLWPVWLLALAVVLRAVLTARNAASTRPARIARAAERE